MHPLLDTGYVAIGIITGVITALIPFLAHFFGSEHAFVQLLIRYHLALGIIIFVCALLWMIKRRTTIECACTSEPHTHNTWVQSLVALIFAAASYTLVGLVLKLINTGA
jgi:hypothetical protein